MAADTLLWLLQANDSSYPSGSYAHSFGLEELVETGVVKSPADLENFIVRQIIPALVAFEIPQFVNAHGAAVAGDAEALLALDRELDAWRIPHELRDGSRRIGSQRLELLHQLAPTILVKNIRASSPRCHHLVVTALELCTLSLGDAARAFAFQAIVCLTSAAMKLLRIGQTAVQAIALRSLTLLGEMLDAALSQAVQGWYNPLLEIASLRHARAHSRLFIS